MIANFIYTWSGMIASGGRIDKLKIDILNSKANTPAYTYTHTHTQI